MWQWGENVGDMSQMKYYSSQNVMVSDLKNKRCFIYIHTQYTLGITLADCLLSSYCACFGHYFLALLLLLFPLFSVTSALSQCTAELYEIKTRRLINNSTHLLFLQSRGETQSTAYCALKLYYSSSCTFTTSYYIRQ